MRLVTPAQRYREEIERGALEPDEMQRRLVDSLQRIHDELVAVPGTGRGWLEGLRRRAREKRWASIRGLYVWGGVGRGKTHLVNAFHDSLPFDQKLRIHFHSFMQYVHGELKALGGQQDPLGTVADGLADDVRVLSFDEFHVSDIADAMILGRLLDALFARGVVLVATSNIAPGDLYRDGLQRARFLPAIDLIHRHAAVLHLDGGTDYRLRALTRAAIYHQPLDAAALRGLEEAFAGLGPENVVRDAELLVSGRTIPALRMADGIAWFDFAALCEGPRSATDYIEIAKRFHTLIVSGVPRLDDDDRDRTLRFVHLVDELYDRSVNLLVSAAAPPSQLYAGTRLTGPFARTGSRLEEMQSRVYLSRPHVA